MTGLGCREGMDEWSQTGRQTDRQQDIDYSCRRKVRGMCSVILLGDFKRIKQVNSWLCR